MQITSEHHLYLDDKEFIVMKKVFGMQTLAELQDSGWSNDELQAYHSIDQELNVEREAI